MGQPNPTNDQPSMDDILSSIRRIIERSDTQGADAGPQPPAQVSAAPAAVPAPSAEAPVDDAGADRPPMSRSDLDSFAEALDARAPGSFDESEGVLDMAAAETGTAGANGKYEARFSEDDSRAFAEVASVLSATAGELRSADKPVSVPPAVLSEVDPAEPDEADTDETPSDGATAATGLTPLISSEVSRSVETSFGVLSETLKAKAGRDLEAMTEQMLRPMLAEWLDDNLPSMVERLVRAEIERIARGDPRQG